MSLPVKLPTFASPPDEYDKAYMEGILRQIKQYMQFVNAEGNIYCADIIATTLPTSADGLRPGTFYNDNGTIKVVLEE